MSRNYRMCCTQHFLPCCSHHILHVCSQQLLHVCGHITHYMVVHITSCMLCSQHFLRFVFTTLLACCVRCTSCICLFTARSIAFHVCHPRCIVFYAMPRHFLELCVHVAQAVCRQPPTQRCARDNARHCVSSANVTTQ